MKNIHPLCGAVVFAVLFTAPVAMNGQVPVKTLSKPEVEFAEPFSGIVGIRELRDARVIVSDNRDKIVQVVDLKGQKAVRVGREGSGPGEYGLPAQLFALPNDTSMVFDPLNSRYLTVLPDGKTGPTFRIGDNPTPSSSPGGQMRMGGSMSAGMPRAVDALGRLYFEGSPITFGPEGPVTSDSAPVMRYDRKTSRFDTLTFVQLPKNAAQVQTSGSGGNRNVRMSIGGQTPYPMRDAWTVLPNGTVAVVRVKDYHVELVSSASQRNGGAAVAYTPVRIGEAEKAEYRDQQKRNPGIGFTRTVEQGGSGAGRSSTNAINMPPGEEPSEWPAVKPAFTSVLAAPNGEIWVARSRSAKDDIPRYDIFSAAGRLTRQVLLPRMTRVIGFGAGGTVYTIRTDADDLQYLQRFRG